MTLNQHEYSLNFVSERYCLGEIPDFQGLLPKSHQIGVPVYELLDAEIRETGTVLDDMKNNRERFKNEFESINEKLISLLTYA